MILKYVLILKKMTRQQRRKIEKNTRRYKEYLLEDGMLSCRYDSNIKVELYRRKQLLNATFEWTPENTRKIIELNNYLWQLLRQIYDSMLKFKNDFDSWIASGDESYKGYTIYGELTHINTEEVSMEECNLWFNMERITDNWETRLSFGWNPYGDIPEPIKPFEAIMDYYSSSCSDSLHNPLDTPHLKGINICPCLMDVMVNKETYSLADLTKMKFTDFKYNIEVDFGWKN